MRKTELAILIVGIVLAVIGLLGMLPPAGWLWIGLIALSFGIYWLAGVMTRATERLWRQR